MLRLLSVSRHFGRQAALDRVTLHVRRGDCYGFIGHNGAGKTTAMRIALGLQAPDAGTILIDGFDACQHVREAHARVGALIEVPGFHGSWSGAANLALMSRLNGRDARAARAEADRLLARVGLEHAGSKHVSAYSHGMRQRLGIAQALIGEPELLLLDEPTNGLDPEGIAEVRSLLSGLREGGLTVFVSSHQLGELSELCNRIGVLREGRLCLEEETDRLLARAAAHVRVEVVDAARAQRVFEELELVARGTEEGVWQLDLGARSREEVTRALVDAGAGLRVFAPEEASLEAIYLATAEDCAPAPPSAVEAAPPTGRPAARRAPGHGIARVVRHELERWRRTPGVALLCALPAVIAAIAVLRRRADALENARQVADAELFSATGVTAFEGFGVALQAALPLLAFALLGIATQSIAGEASRGTLRNLVLRPVTRLDVAAGKALALLVLGALAYALALLAALGAAAWAFDFGDVVEVLPNGATFPLVPAQELWPELWRAIAAPLLPLAAYATLGLASGARARTGAGALGLGLALGVALDLARGPLRAFGREGWVPSAYLPSPLSDRSFLYYYVDVSSGVSNASFDFAETDVIVPLAYFTLALAFAGWTLCRRSIA